VVTGVYQFRIGAPDPEPAAGPGGAPLARALAFGQGGLPVLAVYFPGSSGNEVETAEGDPISFDSDEPYTLALLILWKQNPGTEGIFRSGSSSNGSYLWMTSSGKLWGRHADADSPASGNGPTITAGWHTLVRVWDGQEVRQYVDGLRSNTTAVTATGAWTIHRWGWQFAGSQRLDEASVPFFGAFGIAWDDAMVARWSANPLAMLWPEMDVAFVTSGGGSPANGAAAGGRHCRRLGVGGTLPGISTQPPLASAGI
jgi:hypothetical protein